MAHKRYIVADYIRHGCFWWVLLCVQAAVEPFPGYNIHLVNEAYGIPAGWLWASFYT